MNLELLKLSPPLRTEEDRVSLIDGINKNLIDVIVSDHKPEDEELKDLPFPKPQLAHLE